MSQPTASSSMSTPPTRASSSNFKLIFENAFKAYQKKAKQDLTVIPLFNQLQACDSPAAILTILQDQVDLFIQSRSGDERLKRWLSPTINVLYAFSETLGAGVGLVFSPANAIFAGAGVLLLAAKEVEDSQDVLIDVFERIENFFRRLEIYTNVPPTPAMTDMMGKIMVEVLDILGTATKEMKQSRAKNFLKKVAGIRKLEDGLKKLDKMTNEEARMANAEVLKIAHNIDKKVEGVDEKVQGVGTQVKDVDKKVEVVEEKVQMVIDDGEERAIEAKMAMQQITVKLDDVKRSQLRELLRKWQSPPDPSTNHNIACELQHERTTQWFCQGSIYEEWMASGSLLWVYGKAGAGKSILCSAIINDITTLYDAGSASMAYFYFDFRDIDKRSRRNLLPSLLVQLSTRSDPFCDILSRLYKAHDDGARQPSETALVNCLKEMLTLPGQAPVYLVLDALDECPNTSGVPSSREQVLDLVKELVDLHLPSLRICVTSRPEADIQDTLESLVSHRVSLHEESGQKEDIAEYVRSVVGAIRRWRDADKDLVIKALSERADGMFRWVFCQLETLRHCLPQSIPHILNKLPASLDETYERVLKEIGTANHHFAYRLLQCLAVATRPLSVEELAEILALDFDVAKEGIPELKEDWRSKDQREAILLTCSSLVSVVNDHSRRVVQFSHFSVKEFLTSDRLATSSADISHFHILPEPSHTVIAKGCLGILLQSNNGVGDAEAKSNSPLAEYAARSWVRHARFEKVSVHLQAGMQRLFDLELPYFEAWLRLYDIANDIDKGFPAPSRPRPRPRVPTTLMYRHRTRLIQPRSPLYYASLCGFRDLTAHLVVKHPQHVNGTPGRCFSPLGAALRNRHFDIAELLCQHGADVGIGYRNQTLLHASSASGFVDIVEWLLDHCIDPHLRQDNHEAPLHLAEASGHLGQCKSVDTADDTNNTPLHLASLYGHFKIVRLLIEHGAKVTSLNRKHQTPLHLASSLDISSFRWVTTHLKADIVRALIQHGADVDARDETVSTPLHLASSKKSAKTVCVLIEHGADVSARNGSHETPLHLASSSGSTETVQLLLKHSVDVNAQDGSHRTPLQLASSLSDKEVDIVQMLIERGADVTALDNTRSTLLHLASSKGSAEIVRVLIEHGAGVEARNRSHETPLHLALSSRSTETLRVLLKHNADVNAQDGGHRTPLHLASLMNHVPRHTFGHIVDLVQVLIQHGADVTTQDNSGSTPLHLASSKGRVEIMRILIEHGAGVSARNGSHETPLHLALSTDRIFYKVDRVQVLIQHGADVAAQDNSGSTPLHLASSKGRVEIMRILIEHGAGVSAKNGSHETPLHLALSTDRRFYKVDCVQVLIQHGADVTARDNTGSTPLHLASSKGMAGTARTLIEHGADVSARNGRHEMPLHLAASSGSIETVKLLLKHGVDVNAHDESRKMPLHLASSVDRELRNKVDIVQVLLQHGADVTAHDNTGSTPLHLASSKGRAETARVLIEHGADVSAGNRSHEMPLHLASSSGSTETVQLLLKHSADVNAHDESRKTPLHLALSLDDYYSGTSESSECFIPHKKVDLVQVLIQHGADVTARDDTLSTPLHLASSKGCGESVKLLLTQGADVNAQDGRHSTPLHLAVSSHLAFKSNVVHLLLSHGANADAQDDRGQTPFQIALSSGYSEITELLSNYQVRGE